MRRPYLAGLALVALTATAHADCTQEAAQALERQRKSSAFQAVTSTVTDKGPMRITTSYVLPDRMHQRIKVLLQAGEIERILVGSRAWLKPADGPWRQLPQADMNALRDELLDTVVEAPERLSDYECLGKLTVDGEEVIGYRLDDRTVLPTGKKVAPPEGTPERILYVHPITGLPVRDIAAPRGRPEKPFHKTVYSYAQDIRIEPPVVD